MLRNKWGLQRVRPSWSENESALSKHEKDLQEYPGTLMQKKYHQELQRRPTSSKTPFQGRDACSFQVSISRKPLCQILGWYSYMHWYKHNYPHTGMNPSPDAQHSLEASMHQQTTINSEHKQLGRASNNTEKSCLCSCLQQNSSSFFMVRFCTRRN